jgi:ribonuclease PH
LRKVSFTPNYVDYPEGSVLIAMGGTRVLCNVTVEAGVPRWKQAQGLPGGWITAEYALLPRATHTRTKRETRGLGGRTQEIRRLIGRSLRAGFDLDKLGLYTCIVDCDVLQADGGTRTAAITGGYVALRMAIQRLVITDQVPEAVFRDPVAAVSLGLFAGSPWLDLCYEEDANTDADINVVMNAAGEFIEIQGTAEGAPFSRQCLQEILDLAEGGIRQLLMFQQQVLGNV